MAQLVKRARKAERGGLFGVFGEQVRVMDKGCQQQALLLAGNTAHPLPRRFAPYLRLRPPRAWTAYAGLVARLGPEQGIQPPLQVLIDDIQDVS